MDAIKLLKDVVNFAQKSNDIEMIQKVISAQQIIIDMQEKLQKLQIENNKLKEKINKENNVEHYRSVPIITLKDDNPKVLYCGVCYGNDNKLIPMQTIPNGSKCYCSNCKTYTYIDYSPDKKELWEVLK